MLSCIFCANNHGTLAPYGALPKKINGIKNRQIWCNKCNRYTFWHEKALVSTAELGYQE